MVPKTITRKKSLEIVKKELLNSLKESGTVENKNSIYKA